MMIVSCLFRKKKHWCFISILEVFFYLWNKIPFAPKPSNWWRVIKGKKFVKQINFFSLDFQFVIHFFSFFLNNLTPTQMYTMHEEKLLLLKLDKKNLFQDQTEKNGPKKKWNKFTQQPLSTKKKWSQEKKIESNWIESQCAFDVHTHTCTQKSLKQEYKNFNFKISFFFLFLEYWISSLYFIIMSVCVCVWKNEKQHMQAKEQ